MSTVRTATPAAPRLRRPANPRVMQRARLAVVSPTPVPTPRVPFVALVSLLLLIGIAGLLMFNTSMQQRSFAATRLEQQASVLEAQKQSLKMQLEMLRDPQQLAMRAQAANLVPASTPVFLRLSDGKVLGRPEVADAADAIKIDAPATPKPPGVDDASNRSRTGRAGAAANRDASARTRGSSVDASRSEGRAR